MALSGYDAYGAWLDTGIGTVPTVRASTETEVHASTEIDSGAKFATTAAIISSHGPHRDAKSPR